EVSLPFDQVMTDPAEPPGIARPSFSRPHAEPARPAYVDEDDDGESTRESTSVRREGWYKLTDEPSMASQVRRTSPGPDPAGRSVAHDAPANHAAAILFALAACNAVLLLTGKTEGPVAAVAAVLPLLAGGACLKSGSWGRISAVLGILL